MKKVTLALLSLSFAGCATKPDQSWTPWVASYDQPVSECTKPLAPPPKPALEDHDGLNSARAYRKLKNSYGDLSADYEKCQIWAKGQR